MSRDFIGSQAGRSFKKSQNRDRVTRASKTYKGILRWIPKDPPGQQYEIRSYAGAAMPIPPAGVAVVNAPASDSIFYPSGYQSLIVLGSEFKSDVVRMGLPITFNPSQPPSETNLRPDLIRNPDNSIGFFKMTWRVWGIAPLTNPWFTPQTFTYQISSQNSATTSIDRLNLALIINWDQLTPINWPARPDLTEPCIIANASSDLISAAPGEPGGFFNFDRQIVCYGKWTGFFGLAPQLLQRFGTTSPRFIVNSTSGGNFFRRAEVGMEMNYAQVNPANPASVTLTTGDDPLDNGLTLFGSRPASYIWKRPVVGAAIIGFEYVAAPGQMTITEFRRDQVTPLGLP